MTDAPAGLAGGAGDDGAGDGAGAGWELLVERLLRQPESVWRQVAAERDLGRLNLEDV